MAGQGAIGDLEEIVPPVKVADGAHRVGKVPVGVALPQNGITLDAPGGAELGHARQCHDIPLFSSLGLELLQQFQLVVDQVAVDLSRVGAVIERDRRGVAAAVETGSAAVPVKGCLADIAGCGGPPAGFQADGQGLVAVVIAPGQGGNPGAAEQVGVAGGIDKIGGIIGAAARLVLHRYALQGTGLLGIR